MNCVLRERVLLQVADWTRSAGRLWRSSGCLESETFGILCYHKITRRCVRDSLLLSVRARVFERQLRGLLELGYTPRSLRSIWEDVQSGVPLPPRCFVVTFDDGYQGVYRHAWPVLWRFEVPATIFLATAFLDGAQPFPFDNAPDGAADHQPLTVSQCREMQRSGLIELGCHTHTHQDFRGRPREFYHDVSNSLDYLALTFGVRRPPFCYPFGYAPPDLQAVLPRTEVCCGLTCANRLALRHGDCFQWPRLGATEFDTPTTLAAKLDGWYGLCQSYGRRVRDFLR